MFLTTEPSLAGKNYHALRIIFATVDQYKYSTKKKGEYPIPTERDETIEIALGELSTKAMNLGADAVIGIHVSTAYDSRSSLMFIVTVMGTAIKF